MAITGAAAIAGVAAGALGVSTTVIAVAGLAITAVGMITKNSTLMKIGGGIGIGGAVGNLASAAGSAANGATDAAQAGIDSTSIADAAGAGSQSAGDVAESAIAANTPDDLISGYGTSAADGLVNSASGVQTATDAATNAAGAPLGAGGSGGAVAPVDSSLNGAAANDITSNLASQSPAQQAIGSDLAAGNVNPANANAANVNPVNANAANVNPTNAANPATIADNTAAASPVAPGSQASVGTGSPAGFDAASAYTPVQNGLQAPSSWWSDATSWFTNPKNNGLLQLGGGLIKGVGQGAAAAIQGSMSGNLTDYQKWQMANGSGAASVPTVGISPSGAPSPYATPAQIAARAKEAGAVTTGAVSQPAAPPTVTPAYTGLINKQRS